MSILERTRIQMNVLVPLIRDFQKEFGEDEVIDVLKKRIQKFEDHMETVDAPEADIAKSVEFLKGFSEENGIEYDLISSDSQHYSYNVTSCAFASLMKELDAVDLGPYLICNFDFGDARNYGFKLQRTQTCMEGSSHCDFHNTKL